MAAAPPRILVGPFAASPDTVKLDPSPAATLQRQRAGLSNALAQIRDAQQVQATLAGSLAQRLEELGL